MSGMEDFIKSQNRIIERLVVPKVATALTLDRGMPAYTNAVTQVASMKVEPALFSFMTELQKYREVNEAVFKSFVPVQQTLNSIFEEYHKVSKLVSIAQKVQESIQPISSYLKDIQPVWLDTKLFLQLTDIRNRVLLEPSVLLGMQEVIEAQINSSLWEYEVKQDVFEDPFVDEIQEDILWLAETEDKVGFLNQFIAKWGEKGKAIIISVIKWTMITFIAGLLEHWYEPVYKVLTPSFLLQEENADTENRIEIPINTEIHVWNDITNNFIEITYELENKEYQGYMEQKEFEKNTEKISDEVELGHIVFVNNVTQLLAKEWNIQPEQAYSFLKDDTDLLNDYLLKHYDVLGLLDEVQLVDSIEQYCDEQRVTIPRHGKSNDYEPSGIE